MVMDMVKVLERCKATPIRMSEYSFLNFFQKISLPTKYLNWGVELRVVRTHDSEFVFIYCQHRT